MKKSLLGIVAALTVLAITAITVQARPRANRDTGVDRGQSSLIPQGERVVADPRVPPIETTGFEDIALDGDWEAGFQICGPEFDDVDCDEPQSVTGCTAIGTPPAATENCCANWPNPGNGWFVSGASLSCTEPSIRTIHPSTGTQHLRIQSDTSTQDFHRVFTPVNGLGAVQGPTTIEFDISGQPGGSDVFFGMLGGNGAADGQTAAFLMFMYFYTSATVPTNGYIFVYDPDTASQEFAGYWAGPGLPNNTYRTARIETDPCRGADYVRYFYNGVQIYQHSASGVGPAIDIDRTTWQGFANGATNVWDIDDYSISRGLACPVVCGDGFADSPEECDPAEGAGSPPGPDDENCPGRCQADCTCDRVNVDCDTARVAENGMNGPYISDGGYFTYTADTEFITIDSCGSSEDTGLFWNIDATCSTATDFNDDCIDHTYGGGQTIGTPGASCYSPTPDVGANPRTDGGNSCLCIPTMPGTTYTFAILYYDGSTPHLGTEIQFNINKKLSCTEGGSCTNNGTSFQALEGCNGACSSAAGAVCDAGVCDTAGTPGTCTETCTVGIAGPCSVDSDCNDPNGICGNGNCQQGNVGGLCNSDADCNVPPVAGHCDLGTSLCDAGTIGAPCATDAECNVAGIPGTCQGTCLAGQAPGTPCKGDNACDVVGVCTGTCTTGVGGPDCDTNAGCTVPPTNLCTTGPNTGLACTTNANCGNCTAPAEAAGADCTTNASCRRCTAGAPPTTACPGGNAQCRVCTGGPNTGAFCTLTTQETDCGKFCANDGLTAEPCLTSTECAILGEKVPGGACCDGWTGLCTDAVADAAACTALSAANGTPAQATFSAGKLCEFEPVCVRHTGACCDGNPKAVHCTDGTYPEDCDGANQSWVKGASCSTAPSVCPALTLGACCNTLTGDCTDDMVNTGAAGCGDTGAADDQRVFTLDTTCGNTPCDAVLGACCDQETFGGCTDVTQAECFSLNAAGDPNCPDCVWTKLGSCATTPCIHNSIPTVSEWGIVVLTLLLLTGAKIYFGRRQSAAA